MLAEHKRTDEALVHLLAEQTKVETKLDVLDRELAKVLEVRFNNSTDLRALDKDNIITKFYGVLKSVKGYEAEISKISEEVEQTITRNASDDGKGLEAQLNICISACYETIVALNAKLIKIQDDISVIAAQDTYMY